MRLHLRGALVLPILYCCSRLGRGIVAWIAAGMFSERDRWIPDDSPHNELEPLSEQRIYASLQKSVVIGMHGKQREALARVGHGHGNDQCMSTSSFQMETKRDGLRLTLVSKDGLK